MSAVAGMVVGAIVAAGAPAVAATPPAVAPVAASITVTAGTADDLSAEAHERVASLSLRDKAASVVMGHIPTTDPSQLRTYMRRTHVGGFILMGANIPGSESALRGITSALTADAALPPLIGIDEEGGDVTRLPWDDYPAAWQVRDESAAAARAAYAARAALVQRAGIGVNFGVIADVTDDSASFIYDRVLGTTPDAAADRVAAAVEGEGGQVLTTLKHFPGHGAVEGNSHVMIPATDLSKADWEKSDAVPFRAGVDAGAPLLMFGHLAYTAVDEKPASLSTTWHEIARDELGFTGVAITDDLGMLQASGVSAYADPVANAVDAIAAGNDMVLAVMFTTADSAAAITDGIVAAVKSGTLSEDRLDDAAERVMALRLQTAASGRGLLPVDR
jgi:beta-N-acetylhexosaminidase